jgi:hypothetical protein
MSSINVTLNRSSVGYLPALPSSLSAPPVLTRTPRKKPDPLCGVIVDPSCNRGGPGLKIDPKSGNVTGLGPGGPPSSRNRKPDRTSEKALEEVQRSANPPKGTSSAMAEYKQKQVQQEALKRKQLEADEQKKRQNPAYIEAKQIETLDRLKSTLVNNELYPGTTAKEKTTRLIAIEKTIKAIDTELENVNLKIRSGKLRDTEALRSSRNEAYAVWLEATSRRDYDTLSYSSNPGAHRGRALSTVNQLKRRSFAFGSDPHTATRYGRFLKLIELAEKYPTIDAKNATNVINSMIAADPQQQFVTELLRLLTPQSLLLLGGSSAAVAVLKSKVPKLNPLLNAALTAYQVGIVFNTIGKLFSVYAQIEREKGAFGLGKAQDYTTNITGLIAELELRGGVDLLLLGKAIRTMRAATKGK